MEKFLPEGSLALRRETREDVNVNELHELRHRAQVFGVREAQLLRAVNTAGISARAVQAHLLCH